MGYEIAGGFGARIAQMEQGKGGDTIVFVGDGSYLLLNSDIYSSVLSARKLIIILCDNGGYAVIDKLQRNTGNVAFNNYIADCQGHAASFPVDFALHARAMGANSETIASIDAFDAAFARAQKSDRTYVIEIKVDPYAWTEGGHTWWDIGTPQVSRREEVLTAGAKVELGRNRQRRGV
jgi:3D-(3,5/4)-trihydroxycyclohexane-1,2-dione acylhydrolase (decyclizing)